MNSSFSSIINCIIIFLQISYHHGSEISDPERRDSDPHSKTSQMVSQFIQKHFKGVSVKPAIMELCMYTITVSSWF